jgi:integrase
VADWLEGGLPGRAERTKDAYKEALSPLLAMIGHRPLRELTAMEVRKGLGSLAPRYSTRYLQIAHNSLEWAIRFGQIHQRVSGNVAELVEVPKGATGRPSKSLTLGQAQDLMRAAKGERLYPYIVLSLLSGMRTEEVRSLRWDHVVTLVDDASGWKPVSEVGFDGASAGRDMFAIYVWRSVRAGGDTKTPKSRRSLQLPKLAVAALRTQQRQQDRDRLIAGERWHEHGLVFASAVGTPLLNGNVRRAFRSVCIRAGIGKDWTPRELRHTFVSLMSDTGLSIEEISRLVGHSSTHTTETVYRHELKPVIRSGADAMNQLFPHEHKAAGSGSHEGTGQLRATLARSTSTARSSANRRRPVHTGTPVRA